MQKVTKITAPPSAPITLKVTAGGPEPSVPQVVGPGLPTPSGEPEANTTPMAVNIHQIP